MNRHDEALAPRLVYKLERGGIVGYLQPNAQSAPMKIGTVDSPEFKLVESLFSTSGSDAHYRSVKQDAGRAYAKATGASRTFDKTSRIYNRVRASLNEIILRLRYTQAGKYLSFTQGPTYVAMDIHADRRFA
jgi:hypothetical protein